MNNLLKPLDPIITKLGLDQLDTLEILKAPCAKVGIRPAYAVSILLAISIFSIVIGVASGFLSSFISMVYPAYASIKAIESTNTQDDKMWLTYWIVFSFFTILDSSCGFLLSFIPFYHLIKLVFFVILFHPAVRGAEQIYQMLIHPLYQEYHSKIDSKLQDLQNQAKDKLNKHIQ